MTVKNFMYSELFILACTVVPEVNFGKSNFKGTDKKKSYFFINVFFFPGSLVSSSFSQYIKHTSTFLLLLLRKSLLNAIKNNNNNNIASFVHYSQNQYKKEKKKKRITFSSLECATFRTLMTALQLRPLICSIRKLNLADMHFQCSSSVSGPESSASFLIC